MLQVCCGDQMVLASAARLSFCLQARVSEQMQGVKPGLGLVELTLRATVCSGMDSTYRF